MEFNATFIVAFISFVIFIIIMNNILYKPINDIIEKRNKFIDENYNSAHENKEKSEAILQDRLDKLQNARSRVKEETTSALDKVRKEKLQAQENVKQELKAKIKENTDNLNDSKKEATEILKKEIITLAQIISDKFIETPEKITDVNMETIEKIMQD